MTISSYYLLIASLWLVAFKRTARAVDTSDKDNNGASNGPLLFENSQKWADQVMIYFDPNVDVKDVVELASRAVRFNATGADASSAMTETYGEWRALITSKDKDDGTKR